MSLCWLCLGDRLPLSVRVSSNLHFDHHSANEQDLLPSIDSKSSSVQTQLPIPVVYPQLHSVALSFDCGDIGHRKPAAGRVRGWRARVQRSISRPLFSILPGPAPEASRCLEGWRLSRSIHGCESPDQAPDLESLVATFSIASSSF